ncbi:TPA: glycosyltransferase family 2 protein [Streptococcus suis]|nr:glycosyltransferase family 2 protein [Streptococcus suis]
MKFSVIIPAYNISDYIEECVQSVLVQKTNDLFQFEVILINDGSTDFTGELCDRLQAENSIVKTIHQQNQGLSGARNTGIEAASGDYLLFLDGDDFWSDSQFLLDLFRCIDGADIDIVIYSYSDYFINKVKQHSIHFDSNSFQLESDADRLVSDRVYNVSAWTKCVKSKLIQDNDLRFEVGRLSEDCYWSIDLLKIARSYYVLNNFQYMYRQNRQGSITQIIREKNVLDILESIEYGMSDLNNYSPPKIRALRMLGAYFYLATLPSVYNYKEVERIKQLLEQYRYLVDDIFLVNDNQLQWRGRLVKWLGIMPSSYLLSNVKVGRNLLRKLKGI